MIRAVGVCVPYFAHMFADDFFEKPLKELPWNQQTGSIKNCKLCRKLDLHGDVGGLLLIDVNPLGSMIFVPVGRFHINLYGMCRFSGYHFSA